MNLMKQINLIAGHHNNQIGLEVHNANQKQRSSSESSLS